MPLTMYSASVPVFSRMLTNLDAWLDKAQAHADAKKFDSTVFCGARLAPDMLPFSKQVQIACDTAKFCVARLAGTESPKFDDTEATIAELKQRVRKTIDYVASVDVQGIVGSETREVTMPRPGGAVVMQGGAYLQGFALPNFYFHLTTAYNLLRMKGVQIGKLDYLAGDKLLA